jgi:hypothetical protein
MRRLPSPDSKETTMAHPRPSRPDARRVPVVLPAVVAALVTALTAHAARPLNTDDAGVLSRGDCELEAVRAHDRAQGETTNGRSLQIGCGVGAGTQLALGTARSRTAGERSSALALSGKTALTGEADDAWTLAAALQWASAPGQGRRHVGTALTLLHTRSLGGPLTLHASLGHARDESAGSAATTWGVALEHEGWGAVAPMAEILGDDRAAPSWNAGLRWTALPQRLVLDIAYGRQITGGRPSALSLGAKLAF